MLEGEEREERGALEGRNESLVEKKGRNRNACTLDSP